jgi:hypothetical protein
MGTWRKQGNVFSPPGTHPKLLTHAANPLAVHLHGDVFRVFYSGRDAQNRSSVGAVDVDILRTELTAVHERPFFEFGGADTCYSDGVSIGCAYQTGNRHWMLFMAWQVPSEGHWRGDIGRLEINPDLSLRPDLGGPYLGTDPTDPLSLSYPWVMRFRDLYYMWYGSTVTWEAGNGEMLHVINYATSADSVNWRRHGLAVPYELNLAQAFSRPTVVEMDDGLVMWFSYRSGTGQKYRIGRASSLDGRSWALELDRAGIDVSDSGWDSEMICYPFVFEHAGRYWMLYNGNGFGKSGFGLAVLEP